MNYDIRISEYGTKRYYVNNVLHRKDGPAVEYTDETKFWILNGKFHREDGPAIEYANGNKFWYLNGKCYGENDDFTNISWSKFIKTLIFY